MEKENMDRLTKSELINGFSACYLKSDSGLPELIMGANPYRNIVEKLKKYEDLEEQGKLLKLPCTVGDTVYYLTGKPAVAAYSRFDKVLKSTVRGFCVDNDGIAIRLNYDWKGNHGTYGYLGKTIFLTEEEAEAALKDLKNQH